MCYYVSHWDPLKVLGKGEGFKSNAFVNMLTVQTG